MFDPSIVQQKKNTVALNISQEFHPINFRWHKLICWKSLINKKNKTNVGFVLLNVNPSLSCLSKAKPNTFYRVVINQLTSLPKKEKHFTFLLDTKEDEEREGMRGEGLFPRSRSTVTFSKYHFLKYQLISERKSSAILQFHRESERGDVLPRQPFV